MIPTLILECTKMKRPVFAAMDWRKEHGLHVDLRSSAGLGAPLEQMAFCMVTGFGYLADHDGSRPLILHLVFINMRFS